MLSSFSSLIFEPNKLLMEVQLITSTSACRHMRTVLEKKDDMMIKCNLHNVLQLAIVCKCWKGVKFYTAGLVTNYGVFFLLQLTRR